MMSRYGLLSLISRCLQLYQFSRLLHDTLPELYAHFETNEIEPFLYAAPWFLCLYSATFPVAFASRVIGECFAANEHAPAANH